MTLTRPSSEPVSRTKEQVWRERWPTVAGPGVDEPARQAGSLAAHVVWLGLLFYLAYSYSLYLIGWEQNQAFLAYAVVVTLSVACLLDGVGRIDVRAVQPAVRDLRTRGLGWFLVVVGTLFVALWLSDVGPLLGGGRLRAASDREARRTRSTCWT